jgi:uncharacterized ferredoxin-like protein
LLAQAQALIGQQATTFLGLSCAGNKTCDSIRDSSHRSPWGPMKRLMVASGSLAVLVGAAAIGVAAFQATR